MYPAEPELRGHQASVERGTPSLPLVKELKVKQPFKSQQDLVKVADLFPPQAVVRRGAELNGLRSPPHSLPVVYNPGQWAYAVFEFSKSETVSY